MPTICSSYLSQHGIFHEATCLGIPKQNGIAKRKNLHLSEITHASLFTMDV